MENQSKINTMIIPDNLVIFISGVPGMGKTTISYEMLKKYEKFRRDRFDKGGFKRI